MNIHEYQAKQVLGAYQVPVPRGHVAFTPDEAVKAAEELGGPYGWSKRRFMQAAAARAAASKWSNRLKKFAKKPPACWA